MTITAASLLICSLLAAEGSDFQPIHTPERTFAPSDIRSALQTRKLARQMVDGPAQMSLLTQLARMAAESGPEGLQKLDPDKFPQLQKIAEQLARDPALRERLLRDEKLRELMERMAEQMKPTPQGERREGSGRSPNVGKRKPAARKGTEGSAAPGEAGAGSLSVRPERISGTPEPQLGEPAKSKTPEIDADMLKLLQESLADKMDDPKDGAGKSSETNALEKAAQSVLGERKSDPTAVGKFKALAQSMRDLGGPFGDSETLNGAIEKLGALQKRSARFQDEGRAQPKTTGFDAPSKKGGTRPAAGKQGIGKQGVNGNDDPADAMLPGEALIEDARPGKNDSLAPGRPGGGLGERLARDLSRVPLPGLGDEPAAERAAPRSSPRSERKAAAPLALPQLPKLKGDPLKAIAAIDPKQLIPTPRTAYSFIAFGIVGFAAAMLVRYFLDRPNEKQRRRRIASSVKLLHRESLSVRERVARAFEQLALAIVGEPALAQHHRQLAEQLAPYESNPAAPARQAARELADYYELARYSPPSAPTPEGMIIAVEERCQVIADSANSIVPVISAPTGA